MKFFVYGGNSFCVYYLHVIRIQRKTLMGRITKAAHKMGANEMIMLQLKGKGWKLMKILFKLEIIRKLSHQALKLFAAILFLKFEKVKKFLVLLN
jgi:hypothetical protein